MIKLNEPNFLTAICAIPKSSPFWWLGFQRSPSRSGRPSSLVRLAVRPALGSSSRAHVPRVSIFVESLVPKWYPKIADEWIVLPQNMRISEVFWMVFIHPNMDSCYPKWQGRGCRGKKSMSQHQNLPPTGLSPRTTLDLADMEHCDSMVYGWTLWINAAFHGQLGRSLFESCSIYHFNFESCSFCPSIWM